MKLSKKWGGKGIKVPITSIWLHLRSMETVNMKMSVTMACFLYFSAISACLMRQKYKIVSLFFKSRKFENFRLNKYFKV